MNILIPIGGVGQRFKEYGYQEPKPLIKILGKPMICWVIDSLKLKKEDQIYIAYNKELDKSQFKELLNFKYPNLYINFLTLKEYTLGAADTLYRLTSIIPNSRRNHLTISLDIDVFYEEDVLEDFRYINDSTIFYTKDYNKNPLFSYIELDKNDCVIKIEEKKKISDNACIGAYGFKNVTILKKYCKELLDSTLENSKEYYISFLYKKMIKNNEKVEGKIVYDFYCVGTPLLLQIFANTNYEKRKSLRICFDIDNTLLSYPEEIGNYTTCKPIYENIRILRFLKKLGHTIILYTARRMRTHKANTGKVLADIGKDTLDSLEYYKILYDEIYFGKPYAHFYIDDSAINPYKENIYLGSGFYNLNINTRYFNSLEYNQGYVKKESLEIKGEKYYYKNIPDELKTFFPKLLDEGDNSIKLERINGLTYSHLFVNKWLDKSHIDKLIGAIKKIHDYPIKVRDDIYIYYVYFSKLLERVTDFKEYYSFIVDRELRYYLDFFDNFFWNYEVENLGIQTIIHGDPVFSNILIDKYEELKFIDMRGEVENVLTIQGDKNYDIAKIYQSLYGYDFVLLGKEIDYNYIKELRKYFESKFDKEYIHMLKHLTASLYFSLLKCHHDLDKRKSYFDLMKDVLSEV